MPKSMKINIRFGAQDEDLRLLATSSKHFDDIVIYAIDHYLGKAVSPLPLPSIDETNLRPDKAVYTIYLDNVYDKDAVDLLQGIVPGYRSFAIKLLIRHAMERCDLRALQITSQNALSPRKRVVRPRRPKTRPTSVPCGRPTQKPVAHIDEDDVFNAI